MDLDYWYLFPVAVAIATVYTSTGIAGANFWVPVYTLWLGLEPRTGFWLALFTMLFSSSMGVAGHAARRNPHWRLAGGWLAAAIPAAVLGALAAPRLPVSGLTLGFGLFAVAFGGAKLREGLDGALVVRPPDPRRDPLLAAAGGLLVGAISVGLGALLLPRALARDDLPRRGQATGTVLVAVFVTSMAAALTRLEPDFAGSLREQRGALASILVWVVPGVLTGGLVGPWLASKLDRRPMLRFAGAVLILAGALMLWRGALAVLGR